MTPDALILGGGLAGLAVALASASRGLLVTIVTTRLPGEASPAAAGMLAPTLEHAGEANDSAAHAFALASRDRYPDYVAWLADRTGIRVPLDRNGILEVAADEGALNVMATRAGRDADVLDVASLRAIEPALRGAGGILHPHDGSVDNVVLLEAMREAVARSTITFIESRATRVAESRGDGIRVQLQSGEWMEAGSAVLAAGAWAGGIAGLPRPLPVRPVRGQMVSYEGHPLRRVAYGPDGYLVPRASGRILAGATMEDAGFHPDTTPEAIAALHAMAERLCPALGATPVERSWAGLRPVTPDLLPLLGPDPLMPALVYACGHSRNGVLMAPLTGDCIGALLAGEPSPHDLRPFSPSRFD